MLIAQISDLHVVAPGSLLGGVVDTNAAAEAAAAHLRALDPEPDVLIVSGDLTESGSPDEYGWLREVLDGVGIPYFVIPGNHDSREPLVSAFGDRCGVMDGGFVQYVVDDYAVRIVALDTLIEGREDGLLCERRLEWLDETLSASPARRTLIAMHHPPFETGVWWMDTAGLSGARELRSIVQRHPQVTQIVCGHIHRAIHRPWGGTIVSVAPSTSHQVALDLRPEAPPRFVFEQPGCLLHMLDGCAFVTHTSLIGNLAKELDVTSFMPDWELVKKFWTARKAALR